VPGSAASLQSAVTRLGEQSAEIRAAIYLDAKGTVVASEGLDGERSELADLVASLLAAADSASVRTGGRDVGGVEVSSPAGGVFAVRGADGRALIAVTAGGALSGLAMYDLRMALSQIEREAE
jgi:predicted regulator of Ras-like GTPase activity (Roadblock/LC7/MglB family)